MENKDFRVSVKAVRTLIIGWTLFTVAGAVAKVQHWDFSHFLLISGMVLFYTLWVIVISDMSKNKFRNKSFWVMYMLILPPITTIVYLIRRSQLLR